MDFLQAYWHQIIFALGMVVVSVRLDSEVKSLRKDLTHMTKELQRRDTYVETVRQGCELQQVQKNVSSLWDFVNRLNDRDINK
jgi:hypothetical protein